MRSEVVITTREIRAITSAAPRGMTGASAATRASSRGPIPPGNTTIKMPADHAIA